MYRARLPLPSVVSEKLSGGEIWMIMKFHELDAKDFISKCNFGDGHRQLRHLRLLGFALNSVNELRYR